MTAVKLDAVRLTSADLQAAIASRYEAPEWHVEPEVTLAGRRLDVVALNLWGARGWRIVGFELKVTRGDWIRELAAFQKSEEWAAVVDAFYVVTPPKLVKDDELPAGWGLLELTGSRMMTRRHAVTRTGATTIPREIAARFITRLSTAVRQRDGQEAYVAREEIRKEEREHAQREAERKYAADLSERNTLRNDYAGLLRALGVDPMTWHGYERALKAAGIFAASKTDTTALRMRLEQNARAMEGHAARMREALAALEAEAEL